MRQEQLKRPFRLMRSFTYPGVAEDAWSTSSYEVCLAINSITPIRSQFPFGHPAKFIAQTILQRRPKILFVHCMSAPTNQTPYLQVWIPTPESAPAISPHTAQQSPVETAG